MPVLEIHCVTAPANTGSVAFHTRLGFVASEPLSDYAGAGDHRITFQKEM